MKCSLCGLIYMPEKEKTQGNWPMVNIRITVTIYPCCPRCEAHREGIGVLKKEIELIKKPMRETDHRKPKVCVFRSDNNKVIRYYLYGTRVSV